MKEQELKSIKIQELNEITQYMQLIAESGNSKLIYSIKKNLDRINKATNKYKQKYNESLEDAKVEFGSIYPDDYNDISLRGTFIFTGTEDNKQYVFTREAKQKLNEKIRKITSELENQKVDIESFIFTDQTVIDTLDEFIVEKLQGVLFPMQTDSEESNFEEIPVSNTEEIAS